MFRRDCWLGLCLVLVMHSALAADAPAAHADAKVAFLGGFLKETRIVYPLQLGEWKAQGEHLYDQAGAGVSVRYSSASAPGWMDVYFYPAGVLSDDEFARVAGIERDELRRAHLQDAKALDMGDLRTFSFTVPGSSSDKPDAHRGYSVDMALNEDGQAFSSAMTLLLDRLYFIKGRYSIPADKQSRDATRETLQQFMAQLLPRIDIASSGDCWMPLPLEPLESGQPDPKAPLATMGSPRPLHFLMRDRVLSRDPGNPGAKVMVMLGMAMQGRLFPGCSGSKSENPKVGDGMREIRLEYPSPDSDAPPGQLLEPAAAGQS